MGDQPRRDLDEAMETGWSEQDAARIRQDGSEFWAASQLHGAARRARTAHRLPLRPADVTERREARQALEQVNRMLSSVIDASPLPIITLDARRRCAAGTPAAEPCSAGRRTKHREAAPTIPESQREEFEQMLTEHGRLQTFTGRGVIRQRKTAHSFSSPLDRAAGGCVEPLQGVVGTSSICSDFQRAEESIRQLNESLEQRVKERTARLEEANEELQAFRTRCRTTCASRFVRCSNSRVSCFPRRETGSMRMANPPPCGSSVLCRPHGAANRGSAGIQPRQPGRSANSNRSVSC